MFFGIFMQRKQIIFRVRFIVVRYKFSYFLRLSLGDAVRCTELVEVSGVELGRVE